MTNDADKLLKKALSSKAEENVGSNERLGKVWKPIFAIITSLGIIFSINEIFRLGLVYHEFVYFYGMLLIFLSSCFIIFPASSDAALKNKVPWYDIVLFLITIFCCIYLMYNSMRISLEAWAFTGPKSSIAVSIIMWALALEALRRTGGIVIFVFVGIFSFYPLFAEHMPGFLEGTGFSIAGAAKFHALTRESIVGIPTRVFCELLVGFMIFGVTLQITGGAKFFIDFAFAILGNVRGGPAKVAVVASALFGTMSGSAVSNVITTGAMTIPTMKKAGYPAYYAGAVEAVASTGGAIMPPVMGAVAFVMASFLNVPYAEVAIAAIVPALLYYWGLFVQVDGFAAKTGLLGLPKSEIPSLKETLKRGWVYIFGILALTYLIFFLRQEAQAPYYASLLLLGGAMFRKETRPNLKTFYNIIVDSGKILTSMLGIMAGVGLLVGGLSMTGVAIAFTSELIATVGRNSLLMLLMGSIVSYILGMGMTITACYIFLAIVLVPALTTLGFDVMAIHMFVLYCGLFSFITPPVALAVYAAAGLAGSNIWKTGFKAMSLAYVIYFIPFFFVYNPALILHGSSALGTVEAVASAFMGVLLIGSSLEGYLIGIGRLGVIKRIIFFACGFMLFIPEPLTDLVGFLIAIIVYLGIVWYRKHQKSI